MTLALGVDIQSMDEVATSLALFGERYLKRIFGEREIEECRVNRDDIARGLAVRFAAKEAVIKALEPHDHIPPWRTIGVLLTLERGPLVMLSGEAYDLARAKGIESITLSVACARYYAIATVIADVTSRDSIDDPSTSL